VLPTDPRSEQPVAAGDGDGVVARGGARFAVDGLHVSLNGVGRHERGGGDLVQLQVGGQVPKDLSLPFGERLESLTWLAARQ
jgi:hypothetical protein